MVRTKSKKSASKKSDPEMIPESTSDSSSVAVLDAPAADATSSSLPEPNLERALLLVMEMMAIRGGSGKEKGVADFIVSQLRNAGVDEASINSTTLTKGRRSRGTRGISF